MSAGESVREPAFVEAGPEAETIRCDVCGGLAYEARCKIVCRRCGYTRDCSDP
jgi:ribosomal protein L37E